MLVKATRALSAVVFLASLAIVVTTPLARAGHAPHIVVEPVVSSERNAWVTQFRVSIVNDSSEQIVVDPDGVAIFGRPVPRSRRARHVGFFRLERYPCEPAYTPDTSDEYIPNANGTTIVWSTPEPRPPSPPAPRETPFVLAPGASILSSPEVFAIGCEGGRMQVPADIYAVATWHSPDSSKRRIVTSNVMRMYPPEEPRARTSSRQAQPIAAR